jgi:hypothetical protein
MRLDPEAPTPETHAGAVTALDLYTGAAEAAARYSADPVLLANIYRERAYTGMTVGRWRAALEDGRNARTALDPLAHPVDYALILDGVAYVYVGLGSALAAKGRRDLADRAFWKAFRLRRRGIALLRNRSSEPGAMAQLMTNTAELLLSVGECPDCRIGKWRSAFCRYGKQAAELTAAYGITDLDEFVRSLLSDHCAEA